MINGRTIKAELKKAGVNTSLLSVTTPRCNIDIRVKSSEQPLEPILAVVGKYERIHRCEYTGEILNGGNTFVHVRYDSFIAPVEGIIDAYTLFLASCKEPKDWSPALVMSWIGKQFPEFAESQITQAVWALHRSN